MKHKRDKELGVLKATPQQELEVAQDLFRAAYGHLKATSDDLWRLTVETRKVLDELEMYLD